MAEKTAKVSLKNLRVAPRKVRLVSGVLTGLNTEEALAQLDTMPQRSTDSLAKLIRSGIASAKEKEMNTEKLIIKNITVDKGQTYRRALARARGRATPIEKKMSHIVLTLAEDEKAEKPEFTIPEKQKKEKKERAPRAAQRETPTPKPDDRKKEKARRGFMRKVFQRKSV